MSVFEACDTVGILAPFTAAHVARGRDPQGRVGVSSLMSANPYVVPVLQLQVCLIAADEATRTRVRLLLERLGVALRIHASADEFLRALATDVPACLIAEATMSDMNGIELLQEVRRLGFDVPTILLGDHEDVPFAVAAMRAGAVDFVERPSIDRALLHHVSHLLALDNC